MVVAGIRIPPLRAARPRTQTSTGTAPAASATARIHAQAPISSLASPGTATSASTATESRSARRSVTVVAVTGSTPRVVRRSTEVTRRISPSRNGRTWLPSRETCSAAQDCPGVSPGNVRVQAQLRNAKASA